MSAAVSIELVPIERDGTARGYRGEVSEITGGILRATAGLYDRQGFVPPWIGYLAVADSVPVGTCSFKSPPRNERVEIAYFTFPDFEGRGLATAMTAELVAIAARADPAVSVAAQTLPGRNASHRVLEKLGFRHVETLEHPEDGTVWEWRRPVVE